MDSTLENGMGGLSNVLSCVLLQQPLRILETHQEIVPNEHVGWSRAIEPVDLGIYQEPWLGVYSPIQMVKFTLRLRPHYYFC